MRGRLRDRFDATSLELADILQAWDVLGVYQDENDRPDDDEEYDDLVLPMRQWLAYGMGPRDLSKALTAKLRSDYGLSPDSDMAALDFTTQIYDWWRSVERP